MIKTIEDGIQTDMQVTYRYTDTQGRVFLRINRGGTQTDMYVTKDGKVKVCGAVNIDSSAITEVTGCNS